MKKLLLILMILISTIAFNCSHLPTEPTSSISDECTCEEFIVESGLIVIEYPDGRVEKIRQKIKVKICP